MSSEQELADANYRIMLYNSEVAEFEDDLDFLVATLFHEEGCSYLEHDTVLSSFLELI